MVRLERVGLPSFLPPTVVKAGWDSSEKAKAPDSGCTVWKQYPHPDAAVGVLKVPLNGYRYSSRVVRSTV